MGKSLGGSQKVEADIPEALQESMNVMLKRAVDMGQTGYIPYTGDTVAGFTPSQMTAQANTNNAAAAFGLDQAPVSQMAGNHSALGLFDEAMAMARERMPGRMDYYDSFFIDPVTGQPGSRTNPYEHIGPKPDGGLLGQYGQGGSGVQMLQIPFPGGGYLETTPNGNWGALAQVYNHARQK